MAVTRQKAQQGTIFRLCWLRSSVIESHCKVMHFVYRVTAVAPEHAFHAKCADCTVQGTAVWMSLKTSSRALARVPLRLARGNVLQPTTHVVVQYELIEKGKGGKHQRWMKIRSKRTTKTGDAFAYPATIPNEVKNNPISRHAKTTGLL
jgi:hypothetical protein